MNTQVLNLKQIEIKITNELEQIGGGKEYQSRHVVLLGEKIP